jgi:hypothetical protein
VITAAKLEKPLTILGAVVVFGTLAFSYAGLRALEADIKAREAQREVLDIRIAELESEIDRLKNAPLTELAEVGALAVELEGRKDPDGRQLFTFSYWLEVPNNRKRDIRRVEYRRRFGERLQDVMIGTEPSNGFGVSYLGWGCFRTVDVTIVEKTGQKGTLTFDQCDITRWGANE